MCSTDAMDGGTLDELIRRAAAGDDAAADELVRSYGSQVRAFLRQRLPRSIRRREDSEDLLQTSLVAAFANLSDLEFRGEKQFVSWLYAVAEQKLLRAIRRHGAIKRSVDREAALTDLDRLSRDQTTASQAAMRGEGTTRLTEALAALPEEDRLVLDLRSRQGLGFREVAERTGLQDADSARWVYRRAIRKLGRDLAEEEG